MVLHPLGRLPLGLSPPAVRILPHRASPLPIPDRSQAFLHSLKSSSSQSCTLVFLDLFSSLCHHRRRRLALMANIYLGDIIAAGELFATIYRLSFSSKLRPGTYIIVPRLSGHLFIVFGPCVPRCDPPAADPFTPFLSRWLILLFLFRGLLSRILPCRQPMLQEPGTVDHHHPKCRAPTTAIPRQVPQRYPGFRRRIAVSNHWGLQIHPKRMSSHSRQEPAIFTGQWRNQPTRLQCPETR